MPDSLEQELKIDAGFKSSQRVVSTDPDKSFLEETLFLYPIITKDDIYAEVIQYNSPSGSIAAGVVQSGLLILPQDPTVGGAYRGFDAPGISDLIMPQRFGTKYSPKFYHSSGAILIQDGDFYANAIFDFKQGYITVKRNAISDTWIAPLAVDGYFYSGRYFSGGVEFFQLLQTSGDIVSQISFNSGGVTQQQLIQTSGNIVVQIPNIQRGVASGIAFSGNPIEHTIFFNPAFPDKNISIVVSSTLPRLFYVDENYTSGSFKILSTSNRPMGSTDIIFWQAVEI